MLTPSICLTVRISSESTSKKKTKTKVQRKWGDEAVTEGDMAILDFSADKPDAANGTVGSHDLQALVDKASLGTRTRDGLYEVKDWEFAKKEDDDDTDNLIAQALNEKDEGTKQVSGSLGALGSIFSRLTGSKILSEQDLKPVLQAMMQHLMKKNVAKDISEKVCEGVGEGLVGKKIGSFQSTYYSHAPNLPLTTNHSFIYLKPPMRQYGWPCRIR